MGKEEGTDKEVEMTKNFMKSSSDKAEKIIGILEEVRELITEAKHTMGDPKLAGVAVSMIMLSQMGVDGSRKRLGDHAKKTLEELMPYLAKEAAKEEG